MKKMIIKMFLSMLMFASLYAEQYTYKMIVPVDIDPIPGNKIIRDGRTYNILYYRFHFLVRNGDQVEEYIDLKAIPISNNGLEKTFVVQKTFDHKLEGTKYGTFFQFCEDDRGNSCTYPISSDTKFRKYSDNGTFTKIR